MYSIIPLIISNETYYSFDILINMSKIVLKKNKTTIYLLDKCKNIEINVVFQL